jgi:hypothetical protein
MRKKIIIGLVSTLIILTLLIGSTVALFSDAANANLSGKAGTVSVDQKDLEIQKEYGGEFGSVTDSPLIKNWNPGDTNVLRWKVENKGTKSVDTRNTVVIYWDEPTPNNSVQSEDIKEWGTMYLYPTKHSNGSAYTNAQVKDDILNNNADDAVIKVDTTLISTPDGFRWGYVYTFVGDTLNGVGTNAETGDATEGAYPGYNDSSNVEDHLEFQLAFHPHTPITYMGYNFVIRVITEAKQHRNTNSSDWETVTP